MKLHFRILGILTLFVALALGAPVAEAQSTTSSSGTASSSFFFWADPPEVGVTDPESTVTLRWYVGVSDQISCTASGFTATITPNSSMTLGSAVVTPPRDTSATYRITCTDFQGTYSKSITMQQNPNFYQKIPTPDYSQLPIGVINLGGIAIPNFGFTFTPAIQAPGPVIYSKTREGIIYGGANYSYTIPDLGSCAGDAIAAGLSENSTYYCLEDAMIITPTAPVCWMFCTGGQTGGGPPPSFSGGNVNGSYKVIRYFYETPPQVIPWAYPQDPAYASATCTSPSICTIYQHVPPQVPPPPVAPTVTLTASPTSIVRGNASALTWSATDADSCTATGFSVGSALSGTASVSPTTTTTYSVTCTGTGGSTTASATVTVTAPPAPTISFTASPTTVMSGNDSSLSWLAANATTCSLSSGIGSVATSGTRSVSPTTTTTYTITCTGTGGSTTASATVTVTAVVAPTAALSASPTSITSGGSSTLTWSSTNATTCSLSSGIGSVATSGTRSVSPTTTTTYTITCTGTGGSTTASATVTVTAGLQANLEAGTVTPTLASSGTVTTLSASVMNTGRASTVTGFTNLFQIDSDADHASVTTVQTDTSPALTPGVSDTATTAYNFATAGTWYVRACADANGAWTGTITESSELDNCGLWTSITVTAPTPLSDLTAGTVTPTTATLNQATTLSAVVTNAGGGSTGRSFNNLFQIDNDADHAVVTSTRTDISPTLGAGAADTTTVSHTFTTAGTWYVRVCADNNEAWAGLVTEANENNNCAGQWTTLVVAPPAAPAISFTASPTSITSGGSSTLTWSSTGATTCTGSGFSTANRTSGTASVSPTTTTTYRVTCTGTGGSTTASATVTVTSVAAPAVSFTASPTSITSGGSSTLTWSSTGATTCTISGGGIPVATSGTRSVSPTTTTTYTITCTGAGGSTTASATVTVTSVAAPAISFTASPTSITSGGSSILTWSSTNATTCTGTGFSTANRTASTASVSPTTTTTYSITCTGAGGSTTASATVTVTGPQAELTAGAVTPTSAVSGTAVSLSGTVTNGGNATASSFTSAIEISGGSRLTTSAITVPAGQARTTSASYTFASAGSYQVRLCADYAGTVTESNENNNCGVWNTVTVTAPPPTPRPDLTTGVATPTAATVGTAASFSADITNAGTLNAGASTASIWIQNAGGAVIRSANISTAAIVVGASRTVSSSYTFTSAGDYSVRVCADNNTSWAGTITELDEMNNCGSWATVTVTGPAQPNLGAGTVTPITTTQNQATSLSATITNTGLASAGRAFTNLFQIDNDADHAAVTTTRTDTSPNIGAGGTDVSTVSYTFATAGPWYVRACADNNAVWTGVVTESNELDNCGLWTTVTVSSLQPTATLSASPSTIENGNSTNLYWSSTNATTCTGTGFSTGGTAQGTAGVAVTPSTTSTYQVDCTGPNGTAFAQATVTVTQPSVDIVADDERVTNGGTTTIHWTSTSTTACTVSGPNSFLQTGTSGSSGITVTAQGTYNASCTTTGGQTVTDSVIVNILPKFEEF